MRRVRPVEDGLSLDPGLNRLFNLLRSRVRLALEDRTSVLLGLYEPGHDVDRRAVTGLKLAAVLPERLAVATVAVRLADFEGAKTALMEPVRLEHLGGQ